MVRLSIIVPAVGAQSNIDETLVSVLEHRPEATQVVLVHPRGYVDPYDLQDEVEFVLAESDDLVSLCNVGFSAAQAEVVGVFRPGVRWTEDGSAEILELFGRDRNLGSVSPALFAEDSRRRIRGVAHHWARGKELRRRSAAGLTSPLLGAGFFRAAALSFMHGYNTAFAELADVELGIRMSAAGYGHMRSDFAMLVEDRVLLSPSGTVDAGGRRARLAQLAAEHGIARPQTMIHHFLAEIACHGLGMKAMRGVWGRLAEVRRQPHKDSIRPIHPAADEAHSEIGTRRAA